MSESSSSSISQREYRVQRSKQQHRAQQATKSMKNVQGSPPLSSRRTTSSPPVHSHYAAVDNTEEDKDKDKEEKEQADKHNRDKSTPPVVPDHSAPLLRSSSNSSYGSNHNVDNEADEAAAVDQGDEGEEKKGKPKKKPASSSSAASSAGGAGKSAPQGKDKDDSSADRRCVQVRHGEFEWNEDDQAKVNARRQSSWYWRVYNWLPFIHRSFTREHLYGTNQIKSTRYTVLTFAPVNLFEQLAPWIKPANFYFLCIAILQAFPDISTTQGRPSILIPLSFVIIISAIKDAMEDYGRAKQDSAKNNAAYKTYRNGHYHKIASRDLLVGDIIMIEDGQRVPADCVVLSSGLSGGNVVYVDTKNLDGETNLKPKSVPSSLLKSFRGEWKKTGEMDVTVKVEQPNGDMRSFSGELKVESEPSQKKSSKGDQQKQKHMQRRKSEDDKNKLASPSSASSPKGSGDSEPLSLDNFILSDCLVRNTPWLIALIVYSGEDTKIRQNMKAQLTETRRKQTRVFSMTNRIFVLMVGVQVAMCILAALFAGWYQYNDFNSAWYLEAGLNSVVVESIERFFTWFIIIKDFIPISLYVSLELVQFLQARFMTWDADMQVTVNGEVFTTRVNTSSLNEDLAQVHYIFSDKTGTLTDNSMVFRKCVIGNERYGQGTTEAGLIKQAKEQGKDIKQAIRQFTQRKQKEKEQLEKAAKEGQHKDPKSLHVEFDELDTIVHLLEQSECLVGVAKDGGKKNDQKEGDTETGTGTGPGRKGSKTRRDSRTRKDSRSKSDEHNHSKHSTKSDDSTPRQFEGEDDEKVRNEVEMSNALHEHPSDNGTSSTRSRSATPNSSSSTSSSATTTDKSSAPDDKRRTSQGKGSGGKGPASGQQKKKQKPGEHDANDADQANLVREFMYCLSLNNSVFPKIRDEEEVGEYNEGDDEGEEEEEEEEEGPGLLEVVINPVVSVANSVSEAYGTVANLASETVSESQSSSSHTSGGESSSSSSKEGKIEEGEQPEAVKQPAEEEKEGFDDPNSDIIINLEASSPDETALTSFAAVVGFELYSRNEGRVRLRVRDFGDRKQGKQTDTNKKDKSSHPPSPPPESPDSSEHKDGDNAAASSPGGHVSYSRHFEDFEEVLLIDYNSKRKRMTVIVRPYDTNGALMDKVKIYSKGADTAIGDLLADDDPYWESTVQPALGEYGGESLRTLVCAYSEQPGDFYDKYKEDMQNALKHQGEQEKGHVDGECGNDCKLCDIENRIEEDGGLTSLGCTAIEDKLQEGVPTALQTLLDAGMKVWMLTGDTVSTAVNIAMACNLIDSEMENEGRLFVFDKDCTNISDIHKTIQSAKKTIKAITQEEQHHLKQGKGESDDDEDEAGGNTSIDVDDTQTQGVLFGLALHGDVWKAMLKEEAKHKKKHRTADYGQDDAESDEKEEERKSSPGLFRNKSFRKRKKSGTTGEQHHHTTQKVEKDQGEEKTNTEQHKNRRNNSHTTKDDSHVGKGSHNSGDSSKQQQHEHDDDSKKHTSAAQSTRIKSPVPSSKGGKRKAGYTAFDNNDEEEDPDGESSSSPSGTVMDEFFGLCSVCSSVIACRLEPKEKADIVDQMREREHKTCLAIGDGNNDTLMIKRADIGIGIAGVEGTSAVSSSDFALAQFRFLPHLLLVHGRLNHRRIAIMINYIFYKTAFVVWALFFYGFYSQFSGQVFILDWAFQLHNVVYTALPILVFAVFDFDFSKEVLAANPQIYTLTRYKPSQESLLRTFIARHDASLFFSYWDFFEWITISIIHAAFCFWLCITAFNTPASPDPTGQEYGVWDEGLLIYTAIIFSTDLMLIFFYSSWTWLHHVSLWGSLALYCAAMCMFSSSTIFDIAGGSLYWSFYRLAQLPSFYFTVGVSVGVCLMTTMWWQESKRWIVTKQEAVWMEAAKMGKLKERPDEEEQEDTEREPSQKQREQKREEERDEEKGAEKKPEEEMEVESVESKEQALSRYQLQRQQSLLRQQRLKEEEDRNTYTGSLFSYTSGIRSLRQVVD